MDVLVVAGVFLAACWYLYRYFRKMSETKGSGGCGSCGGCGQCSALGGSKGAGKRQV